MEHSSTSLLSLFIISVLAFIVPILTSWFSSETKLHIPVVVGEIICGIIIGKSCLGIIGATNTIPWLDFLYLFGFTYLMFLSGLEVDINTIINKPTTAEETDSNTPKSLSIFSLGFLYFVFTLFLSFIVSYWLKHFGFISNIIMMTLILSTTSVSIVVPALKEKLLTKTEYGQTILISALIADFMTMLLVTGFVAFSVSERPTLNLLILFLVAALLILIYRLHLSKTFDGIINYFSRLKPVFKRLSGSTTQLKVRGVIALMVIFIAASQAMGIEVILGAFLSGIVATLLLGEEKTFDLESKLDAIGYGFFIPIFFICVGINLDLNLFFSSKSAWVLLVLLIVAAFAIKVIPSFIFKLKFPLKKSLGAGFLLSSRLSLIIAASTIGVKEGFISETVNATIVMVAVVSCIIAPMLFYKLSRKES